MRADRRFCKPLHNSLGQACVIMFWLDPDGSYSMRELKKLVLAVRHEKYCLNRRAYVPSWRFRPFAGIQTAEKCLQTNGGATVGAPGLLNNFNISPIPGIMQPKGHMASERYLRRSRQRSETKAFVLGGNTFHVQGH